MCYVVKDIALLRKCRPRNASLSVTKGIHERSALSAEAVVELVPGEVYTMLYKTSAGVYESTTWYCAEKLSDTAYAMQNSSVIRNSNFPGYYTDDDKGKDYVYKDVSWMGGTLAAFYEEYSGIETSDYKYGLYLLPKNKVTGFYQTALIAAAGSPNNKYNNETYSSVWLGDVAVSGSKPSDYLASYVNKNGQISYTEQPFAFIGIAPAFNIDPTKITLTGNAITPK